MEKAVFEMTLLRFSIILVDFKFFLSLGKRNKPHLCIYILFAHYVPDIAKSLEISQMQNKTEEKLP